MVDSRRRSRFGRSVGSKVPRDCSETPLRFPVAAGSLDKLVRLSKNYRSTFESEVYGHFSCDFPGIPPPRRESRSSILMVDCHSFVSYITTADVETPSAELFCARYAHDHLGLDTNATTYPFFRLDIFRIKDETSSTT